MAAYKYPRLVEIVADLPKTPTGKIMRRVLRDGAVAAAQVQVEARPRQT